MAFLRNGRDQLRVGETVADLVQVDAGADPAGVALFIAAAAPVWPPPFGGPFYPQLVDDSVTGLEPREGPELEPILGRGIASMQVGGRRQVIIPAILNVGSIPSGLPTSTPLVFDIELRSIGL